MSNTESKVIVTGEIEKVPPEYRAWFDPQQYLNLPANLVGQKPVALADAIQKWYGKGA